MGAGACGSAALGLPARPAAAGAAGLVAGAPVAFVTADAPSSSPCSASLAVMGDSPPTITPTIEYPHFIGHATIQSDVIDGRKQLSVVDIELGLRASASFRLDGSLKGAQVNLECKIAEKPLAEKPLPGQLGFLLSVFAKAELKLQHHVLGRGHVVDPVHRRVQRRRRGADGRAVAAQQRPRGPACEQGLPAAQLHQQRGGHPDRASVIMK